MTFLVSSARVSPPLTGWRRLLLSSLRARLLAVLAVLPGALIGRAQAPNPSFVFPAGGELAYSPAVGSDGTFYFGTRSGDVVALGPGGTERWRVRLPTSVAAPITLAGDDTVLVGGRDGGLRALSSAGVVRWTFQTGGEIWSGPVVGADGGLYLGSVDRKVYALGSDGQLRWALLTGGSIANSPALAPDGTLYVPSRDDRLYAVAPDGAVRWRFVAAQPSSPAVGPDGTVYFGSTDFRLRALEPSGALRWSFDTTSPIRSSPTVAADGRVFVVSWNGEVRCLRADGTLAWYAYLRDEARYSSAALGGDGAAYAVTKSGVLFSLNGSTGATRWSAAAQGAVDAGSPVISSGGVVTFSTAGGNVVAYPGAVGPAAGAWAVAGRDARRSGGSFVARELPRAYGAGAELTVSLIATVPAGTTFYTVEDTPPVNWTVGVVSDNGTVDPTNRKVKFGPFLDGQSRRLTYRIQPPLGDSGVRAFAGVATSDGGDRSIAGRQVIDSIPLHPADLAGVDGWVTLTEMTAYAAAWRRGGAWPVPPAVVPAGFLEQAISIWLAGEAYRYDTNYGVAPAWWVPVRDGVPLYPPPPVPTASIATNGAIVRLLPATLAPRQDAWVTLEVTPATNVQVYAVEEIVPAGWTNLAQVSDAGMFDVFRQRLKWGPFFDAQPRTLTYQVSAPPNATGLAEFSGAAAFDASRGNTVGDQRVFVGTDTEASIFVTRVLPAHFSSGAGFLVRLDSVPPADSLYHLVEDAPPSGWAVTNISYDGWYDPGTGTVRFGPFLDTLARSLTYEVTPPAGASGRRQFLGVSVLDGVTAAVRGDSELDSVPLHPADLDPPDSWLTLAEVTAYGAAWKRGSAWPAAPSPIEVAYLIHAINVWRGGEAYAYDSTVTNAPAWWVLSTNQFPPEAVPPPVPPDQVSTNSTVVRDAPRFFTNGVPILVQLTATPFDSSAVYAVEEELPAGWDFVSASDGVTQVVRGKLRWGPFFDTQVRTFSYQITARAEAPDVSPVMGHGAIDGLGVETSGVIRMFRSNAPLAPEFTAYRTVPDGGFELTLKGIPGEIYMVQASGDLIEWQSLGLLTNRTGQVTYLDTAATNLTRRFYQALWP